MFVCNICNSFAGQSFSAVLRHMGNHRFDPGLSIPCGIDSCPEVYKNYESFRSHVYRKHREVLGPESTQAEDRITGIRSQNGDTESADAHDVATVEEGGTMRTGEDYDPKRSVALFLLKTREERNVTQTALNGMVQDIQGLWKDAMETMKVSFNIGWCVFVCVFYLYYIIFGCRIRCRNICMMGTWMKCWNALMTHHPLMVLEHSTCSTSTLRKTFTSWRVLHISNSYIIMYTV